MDRALSVFIGAWVALFVAANLIGIASQVYVHGFGASADVLMQAYCPFNVANYLYAALALSPAGVAWWWRARLRRRALRHEAAGPPARAALTPRPFIPGT